MDKYNTFRKEYPVFYYHGFEVKDEDSYIFVTYHYEIEGLMNFYPTLKVPKKVNSQYDKEFLNKIIFSAGLAEIPSYWKPTCSPKVMITCGKLNDDQISWVKKLMYHGLGEFFYVNHIHPNYDDFVEIESSGPSYEVIDTKNNYDGYMVAVGGGKDSIVSLEILKNKKNIKVFIMNNRQVCFDSSRVAGISSSDILNVERLFDKNIIELNNRGFLNGHTPISSCIAFIGYLTAYLNDMKYVVLSNEASANEASVLGTSINHQYSKSIEFENDFRYYTSHYLSPNISYFSLLRPLNELQIMSIFTKYPKYFKHFISCNNGGKRKNIGRVDGWCLHCPKCLFVYILMSNFVDQEEMVSIFGENLLDKEEMLTYFLELLGKKETKPFECVGTVEEVSYVVHNLCLREGKKPYLIQYYMDHYQVEENKHELLDDFNEENNVPSDLIPVIKEELHRDRENN